MAALVEFNMTKGITNHLYNQKSLKPLDYCYQNTLRCLEFAC